MPDKTKELLLTDGIIFQTLNDPKFYGQVREYFFLKDTALEALKDYEDADCKSCTYSRKIQGLMMQFRQLTAKLHHEVGPLGTKCLAVYLIQRLGHVPDTVVMLHKDSSDTTRRIPIYVRTDKP